ncbi:hypothetical protein D3C80_2075280 [compost metagenome]
MIPRLEAAEALRCGKFFQLLGVPGKYAALLREPFLQERQDLFRRLGLLWFERHLSVIRIAQ